MKGNGLVEELTNKDVLIGFGGKEFYRFKPGTFIPDWNDVKLNGFADFSKKVPKSKGSNSTFWPSNFNKDKIKEYASGAVYEIKNINGGSMPLGLSQGVVTTKNTSQDLIEVSSDLITAVPK